MRGMRRRTFLALSLSTALAGCSSVDDLLASEQYDEGAKQDLLPNSVGADWPDSDLQADHDLNDSFDRVWITPDEELIVMMSADVYSTIEDAEDAYERAHATASDPREYPLADEAYISDDGDVARCVFRHSNALGQVLSARQSGVEIEPDRQRATTYAELLFEDWD